MQSLFRDLTGIEPTLSFCAPFTLAANLIGIERLLLAIYAEPDLARELLNRVTEQVLAPWIFYQKKAFPRAVKISGADAMASIPVINLSILKQWVVPCILRLRELCGPEVYVANWVGEHYLKRPVEMLELKLTVGPGSIQGQDPDVAALSPDSTNSTLLPEYPAHPGHWCEFPGGKRSKRDCRAGSALCAGRSRGRQVRALSLQHWRDHAARECQSRSRGSASQVDLKQEQLNGKHHNRRRRLDGHGDRMASG